ncbi:hypothetical protein KP509_18G041400 [Ceratopteris richardii]|uniref:PPM-type phosphatase domain-containing protein n=1 Tax=Ceratopteris richardii TaxID=49495 RepID=A0A8T2SR33_CERRI|nr:hypothetical protein KP509_18G041400 [Ceratopteris richardii]
MCNCLSFILDNPALSMLVRGMKSRSESHADADSELLNATGHKHRNTSDPQDIYENRISLSLGISSTDWILEKFGIRVIRRRGRYTQSTGNVVESSSMTDQNATEASAIENATHNAFYVQGSEGKDRSMIQITSDHFQDMKAIEDGDCIDDCIEKHSKGICIPGIQASMSSDAAVEKTGQRSLTSKLTMNGGNHMFSLFTRRGFKRSNQDSMIVWEDFIPSESVTLCAVFDGHGSVGHNISMNVRDKLPLMLASCWKAAQRSSYMARSASYSPQNILGSRKISGGDYENVWVWEEAFHNAFKLMDRDLCKAEDVDCVTSGSTALALIKQGTDLVIANLGDSRAVLAVRFEDSLIPLQLTVDLTPNLPREAERIRRRKGRVLALRKEPMVKRVWLPNENTPGLAMTRAFGDFVVKDYGVISVPEVTHRRITKNDKFIVLATDGIWSVLSNEHVVRIVDTTTERSLAAQAVVDAAVRAWKVKHPESKVDDCAVVCMFLDTAYADISEAKGSSPV